MKRYFLLQLFLVFSMFSQAQVSVKDSIVTIPMIDFTYAFQIPGGDMVDRFGNNSNVGASFLVKTKKNWIFGASGGFMFGSDVKESEVLDPLIDDNGGIVGTTGKYANVLLQQRGFTLSGNIGKIIPLLGPNDNSGIMILTGLGFIQHNIRFQDEIKEVPLLAGDYKRGFDRLSNGLLLTEFLGYRYMSNSKLFNFYAGVEFMQGFTKNRRGYNYNTREKDDKSRTDLLTGFKVGITIPLYKKAPKEFYFD